MNPDPCTATRRGARSLLLFSLIAGSFTACESTDPDNQATGSLTLTVSGLPDATDTDITISGPAGFSLTQAVGALPVTLTDLAPGSYNFTAAAVSSSGVAYVPIPATQTAQLPSGGSATVNTAFGSLTFALNMRAEDITPDGTTALFTDVTSPTADFYFYSINSNTLTLKAPAGDALFNFASGVSSNLRVSAIHGKPENAGLWTELGGWLDLGNVYPVGCEYDPVTMEQNQSGGFDLSGDGTVAVGLVWNLCNAEAFRWTASDFIALDLLGSGPPGSATPATNRATKVSDNGSTAAGFASVVATVGGVDYFIDRWPAIWQANGTGMLIPSGGIFTDDSPGEVLSISEDGSMVAGIWNFEGWYWTQSSGVVKLGTVPGGQTFPNAISFSGQLIFGKTSTGFFDIPYPFVWTSGDGMRSLVDIISSNGLTIPVGYTLDMIKSASADGSVLVGNAYDESFGQYAFILRLPVSVYGL